MYWFLAKLSVYALFINILLTLALFKYYHKFEENYIWLWILDTNENHKDSE